MVVVKTRHIIIIYPKKVPDDEAVGAMEQFTL